MFFPTWYPSSTPTLSKMVSALRASLKKVPYFYLVVSGICALCLLTMSSVRLAIPAFRGLSSSLIYSPEAANAQGASGRAHSCCARTGAHALLEHIYAPALAPARSRLTSLSLIQVKAVRAEHGKKSFGPVLVDQLYGCVMSTPTPPSSNHCLATSLAVCAACPR